MTNDGMPRISVLVVILAALASSSSLAQTDAGAADAGSTADAGSAADGGVVCDPACTVDADGGAAVTFCDPTSPGGSSELACASVPGSNQRCGDIGGNPKDGGWGDDCVLGPDAGCDPGYAFGLSRCDPTATDGNGQHLFCVADTCTFAAQRPAPAAVLIPSAGTHEEPNSTTNCFGCSNSSTAGAVMFGAALLSLRRLRRRG
jgi:hypothetical protein